MTTNDPENETATTPSSDTGAVSGPAGPAPSASPEALNDDEIEGDADLRRKYLQRRFWLSAIQYWGAGGDRLAWPLTFAVLALILLTIAAQYGVNIWNRVTFDALEVRDGQSVLIYSALFLPLVAFSVIVNVSSIYARMTVQRRWRGWLSNRIVDRWLANGHYYQLNLVDGDHDNPEYRIAQDLRTATEAPADFVVGVVSALLSAITFIAVLWTIGGALQLQYGDRTIEIPGFLVIAAIAYSTVASGTMIWIGRRFVRISENVSQAEADYRYVLTRVRENGESIALMGGEEEERSGLDRSLAIVLREWRDLCSQYMRTSVVSHGSWLLAPVVPVILCAPKLLDGTMSLGAVMQAASAFTMVSSAFGWLVDNYPRLADWSAGARRIASLMVSLDALARHEHGAGAGRIVHETTDDAAMRLSDLSVMLDDGTVVINEAEVVVMPGERVLLAGESGTGKSVLVRAIAGLWPWGEGRIQIKRGAKLFMLPQRSYVPIGTLRRAAAYPSPADEYTSEQLIEAFEKCGLQHLIDRIEEEAPWDQTLSGGEKQRLAFVRMFLHKPDIVIFDEATSALDPSSQDDLMALVGDLLKDATVISVAHRPELEIFHTRKIVLERRKGGARFVRDIDLFNWFRRNKRPRWLRRRESRSKTANIPAEL